MAALAYERTDFARQRGMPVRTRTCVAAFLLCLLWQPLRAEVIDRIAISVANRVITTSDIDLHIRIAAFLNRGKPDFSQTGRRAAAERLVEQKLIRRELENNRYPSPAASEGEPLLAAFRKANYPSDVAFRDALAEAGITEQDVRDALLWQTTLLHFIDVRFRPGVQVTPEEIQDYFTKTVEPAARSAHPGQPVVLDEYRDQIEEKLIGDRVDEQMNTWLAGVRRRSDVVFHEEAFR